MRLTYATPLYAARMQNGEPGGTAGRPMLDVLKGRNVTNVLVTVTRWFGGTLLGTGGLVHAYGDGVKQVLECASFEELVEKTGFSIETDYQQYNLIKKLLESYEIYDLNESFGEKIGLNGNIAKSAFKDFSERIFDATNGKISVRE